MLKLIAHSSGDWFGFHYADTQYASSFMFRFHITASPREDRGKSDISLRGDVTRVDRLRRTVDGYLVTTANDAGQFPVEMKQTSEHDERTYQGVLDVEREVITGTYESDVLGDLTGAFIFKKSISAVVMCHRPLVPRPDARALWAFAGDVVRARIRRRRLSVPYIFERLTGVKRFLELMHKAGRSDDETKEIRTLTKGFTVQEGAEIWALSAWYGRVGDLQEYVSILVKSNTLT